MPQPPLAALLVRVLAMTSDLLIIAAGIWLLAAPPRSVRGIGLDHTAAALWAVMVMAGAAIALAGGFRRRPGVECVGSFTSAGGFLVWSAGLLVGLGTEVSVAYACVMAAAAAAHLRRGVSAAAGLALTDGAI